MRNFGLGLFFLTAVLISFPDLAVAKIGVGVSTGKIRVDESLKAGGVYELPPLVVINTGDEPSSYSVGVEYRANQPEIRPERAWFRFTPETFQLEPGKAQKVNIQLTLPVKTPPGDYFAYLEGRPVYGEREGSTRIGIAAAAKLNFTVAPANFLQGVYWRALHFWNKFTPWTYVALVILAGAALLVVVRRFFSFNIGVRKKAAEIPVAEVEETKPKKPVRKRVPRKTQKAKKNE